MGDRVVKVTKKFSGGGDPKAWLRQKIDTIESGNKRILGASIQEGAEEMRENIASRPTAWMAANRGKTGRIETERMLNAVSSKVTADTPHRWTGAFGWVTEQKPYFLVQERGGTNSFTGGQIEAMYAMSDAAANTWDKLKFEIEENIRGA